MSCGIRGGTLGQGGVGGQVLWDETMEMVPDTNGRDTRCSETIDIHMDSGMCTCLCISKVLCI